MLILINEILLAKLFMNKMKMNKEACPRVREKWNIKNNYFKNI